MKHIEQDLSSKAWVWPLGGHMVWGRGQNSTLSDYGHIAYQRGTYIKGKMWPPLEPKTESCFSPISSNWFIRRMAQVLNSGIILPFPRLW